MARRPLRGLSGRPAHRCPRRRHASATRATLSIPGAAAMPMRHFSRGNNFPAVAVPHGFNFWTPVTDAGSNWLYQYQERNGAGQPPAAAGLRAVARTQPVDGRSPDLPGDARGAGQRHAGARPREARAELQPRPTRRRTRTAIGCRSTTASSPRWRRPITPRCSVSPSPATSSQLVFDNLNDHGGITLDPSGRRFSGWSDVKSRLSTGATRMFFYGEVDQPVTAQRPPDAARVAITSPRGSASTPRKHKMVNLRIATSLIGSDQARHNLALEIAPRRALREVREQAQQQWDALLGMRQGQRCQSRRADHAVFQPLSPVPVPQ